MKKFKTKKKRKFIKIFIFIILIIFSYIFTFNFLINKTIISPEKYIKSLLNNNLNNQLSKASKKSNSYISNPISLIEYNMSFLTNKVDNEEETIKYIEEVNTSMKDPIIYIYNTHDTEEYKMEYRYEYSIIPNVKLASYILQEKLENLGINSIVETNSIKSILNENNWLYRDSYRASRILLDRQKENNSLKYFIDIHRDSARSDKTYLEYDNKSYARIMFVVGLEHNNYEPNLDLANKLNEKINKIIPSLSRGVLKKEGPGVNGVYNQDFSPNSMLIEIGGVENNIEQVTNTIHILGQVLYSYIKGE